MSAEQTIQRSSTKRVPQEVRFEYWMSLLQQSLWPVSEWTGIADFSVELQEAPLGCLVSMVETISAHQSRRTRGDVERSRGRCYLLFAKEMPWEVTHKGQSEHLQGGDCVLVDSQGELETRATSGFTGVILKIPVDWVRTWLPEPDSLVGRRIAADSKWGQVVSPMVRQLTPELAAAPPLPHGVLVDQLGAILTLLAGETEAQAMPDLLNNIQDCIRQRCSDPQLTAADVAGSLNVHPRVLHRVLATNHLTFASQLLDARFSAALNMLTSPSFAQLTTIEIARQCGFLSSSHFARAVRRRTGHAPAELRGLSH